MPRIKPWISGRLIAGLLMCGMLQPVLAADDGRVARIGFAGRMMDALTLSALQGAELAVDEANQQRGRNGSLIRFELLPQDDHGSANMATHVAAYFVKSGVSGVVGHWSSDAAFATAGIYEQAGIAQVNFTSTSSELTRRGYKTIFRVVGGTSDVAASLGDAAVDVLKGERIAVIGNDSLSSKALTEAFVAHLATRSKKTLFTAAVSAATSDFNNVIRSATEMQADVIFFSAYVAQTQAFLAAVRRLNVKARILLNTGATNQDFSALDNGNFYALEADIPPEQCPPRGAFSQRFHAKYGRPPSTYSRSAYNAAGALIQAIRHADSSSAAQVTAALHALRYTGLSGEIAFDKAGNRVNPPYTLYHLEGGSWRSVRSSAAVPDGNARCAR